jgi:uncharacterized protein (TIGR03083 family)
MAWLIPERYAAELDAETARLAAAVTERPDDARIPSCPEWTVRDLVTHVGTGHRLGARIIEEKRDSPAPYVLVDAPTDQAEWTGWLTAGARRLNDAVRRHGFDGTVWTWQPRHRTAGFWQRRMLHDLIVHRFDAEPDGDLAPDLAADGVSDILLVFTVIDRLPHDGRTLRFAADDTADRWHVTLAPDRVDWREGDGPADVTVTAPVRDLLLALNRRREPATVTGDRALYETWREATKF